MMKYERNGKIGVIISLGYGGGWSTFNSGVDFAFNKDEFLSMNKTLVEMKLNNASKDEVEDYCDENAIEKGEMVMSGWSKAIIKWVDKGTKFTIRQNDGMEKLITTSDLQMKA